MDPLTLAALVTAALFAGFVDAIVGGGGIITVPALLATGMPPHLALGTNKVVGTGASSVATWQYARKGLIEPRLARIGFPLAFGAAVLGAATVLRLPERFILAAVTVVMASMVAWVLLRPRFGHDDHFPGATATALAAVAGLAVAIGFYDGLLGPGTGTFLLFGLVALTGMPFLRAAAHGRLLNFASNTGALLYFGLAGTVDWTVGLVMALGTVTGGFIGSRAGIKHGARWIRPLFVVVALLLLGRLMWDLAA